MTLHAAFFGMDLRRPPSLSCVDVARGLARVLRYNGATIRPYSVAEHSVLMAHYAATDRAAPAGAVEAALVHDAHEVLLGDLTWPVLQLLGHDYVRVRTAHLVSHVREQLGLAPDVPAEVEAYVHDLDLRICADEARSHLLFPQHQTRHAAARDALGRRRLNVHVNAWAEAEAEARWLEMWLELHRGEVSP